MTTLKEKIEKDDEITAIKEIHKLMVLHRKIETNDDRLYLYPWETGDFYWQISLCLQEKIESLFKLIRHRSRNN